MFPNISSTSADIGDATGPPASLVAYLLKAIAARALIAFWDYFDDNGLTCEPFPGMSTAMYSGILHRSDPTGKAGLNVSPFQVPKSHKQNNLTS